MGQTALTFQIVILPAAQFSDAVPCKKFRRAAVGGEFPNRRLGAVLAELEHVIVGGLRPGTGCAHDAMRFVLAQKGFQDADRVPFFSKDVGDSLKGPPSTGWT